MSLAEAAGCAGWRGSLWLGRVNTAGVLLQGHSLYMFLLQLENSDRDLRELLRDLAGDKLVIECDAVT